MEESKVMRDKVLLVDMKDVEICTIDKPIIGTQDLSPCIGFILHSKDKQKTIVGHISCDQLLDNKQLEEIRLKIFWCLERGELIEEPLQLSIIEGAYPSQYKGYSDKLDILKNLKKWEFSLLEVLEVNVRQVPGINIDSLHVFKFDDDNFGRIETVDENNSMNLKPYSTLSRRFAIDANSGEFVTSKVDFSNINKSSVK